MAPLFLLNICKQTIVVYSSIEYNQRFPSVDINILIRPPETGAEVTIFLSMRIALYKGNKNTKSQFGEERN